jgi:plasmid stabilization system protein ParE
MIRIRWTAKALDDLARLHEFLRAVNPAAAVKAVEMLTTGPERLIEHPRFGEAVRRYAPREVRRLLIGRYEMRYEIVGEDIYLLRIWHMREDR